MNRPNLLVIVAVSVLMSGSVLCAARPVKAAIQELGGLDLYQLCAEKGRGSFGKRLTSFNIDYEHRPQDQITYKWRCNMRYNFASGEPYSLTEYFDMNDACVKTYRDGAKAKLKNRKDPNSWKCFREY